MSFKFRGSGLLVAPSLLALLALTVACSGSASLDPNGQGTVRFDLSAAGTVQTASGGSMPLAAPLTGMTERTARGDGAAAAPADDDEQPRLASAMVTLSDIVARTTSGALVHVEIALPITFDLLSLADGRTISLPVGFLPLDTYDQLVVVITGVELVMDSGTRIEITPPGGGWTAVVPTEPFTIVEGQSTEVHLRLHRHLVFDGAFDFDPEFDCEIGDDHGDGDHDGEDD